MLVTTKKLLTAIAGVKTFIEGEINRLAVLIDQKHTAHREETAEALISARAELRAEADELFRKALADDREKRLNSTDPFVEIVSQNFSEEGGVQLRLDWNPAFIRYLKANGVTGPTDESIVDNWLKSLASERIAEGGTEFR